MYRIIAAVAAFLILTGFTDADALSRFSGGWQAADDAHGTKGAIQIDGAARTIRAASYSVIIDGPIDKIDVLGASAVFHIGDKIVMVYSGPDADTIEAKVGDMPVMRFVRVP